MMNDLHEVDGVKHSVEQNTLLNTLPLPLPSREGNKRGGKRPVPRFIYFCFEAAVFQPIVFE